MRKSIVTIAAAVAGALLAGCVSSAPAPAVQSRDERVRIHFAGLGADIAQKESLANAPVVSYRLVDEERLTDGRTRSLWATTAAQYRSHCFYMDEESRDGSGGGFGACGGGETQQVTLGSGLTSLVGNVGSWPATKVRIVTDGQEAVVTVKERYFLVPHRLLGGDGTKFTLVLLDDTLRVITEVKDLRPAGT